MAEVRPTKYGVKVLSANAYGPDASQGYEQYTERMLQKIIQNSEYQFIDTPNDITTPNALRVLEAADVIVFTANVGIKNSLPQLGAMMKAVEEIGFADKVSASVVVISNTPKGKVPSDYRMYTNIVNIRDQVVQERHFTGSMMVVPYDPVVAEDSEVSPELLDWETYQAYLDINILALQEGLKRKTFTTSMAHRHL